MLSVDELFPGDMSYRACKAMLCLEKSSFLLSILFNTGVKLSMVNTMKHVVQQNLMPVSECSQPGASLRLLQEVGARLLSPAGGCGPLPAQWTVC